MHSNSAVKLLSLILLGASFVAAQSVQLKKDIPAIAKGANGAVVSIVMSGKDGNPIDQGSGFVVTKDGIIVTNYHVIAEGTSAIVKLPDGAFYVVDGVLAFDKARDVAVIKAHGENFRTLTLGNSDRVQVGQEVVAIGNPLSLESTVSNGIVSSIRTLQDDGGKYLQVTAPISPGSSGGPLFNMEGQVIGITTMYLKGGENLNFAIPINDAKHLLEAAYSKLEPFPNAAPEQEQQPATSTAANVQINSPALKYFNDMLAAHEVSATASTYACFNDNPTNEYEAESFRLIRVMPWVGWSVDILNVKKVAVDSIFGYSHDGMLKLDANGKIDATFSSDDFLPDAGSSDVAKAIDKDDYLEWSSDKLSFQHGTYEPPASIRNVRYYAISFTMGLPGGKYVMTFTPEGLAPNPLPEQSETGQCIQIPGSKTLEEKLQGPLRQ